MTDRTDTAPSRALLALAETRVARYTSYPTAAQFGRVEEATYRSWLLEGIRPSDTLSLYLHVPFCKDLCWYCACHAKPTRSVERVRAYAVALHAEAALLAAALPAHAGVSHLHLGGGTPSILGPDGLRELMAVLRREFGLRPGAEIALELDPRVLDEATAEALGELGFTRASLGVQDIDPAVQARIGRPQPTALVELAVERLRRAGINGINIDLMYGLPTQTAAHVAASARFAGGLGADRLAVFGYAHVAWMKPHQKAIEPSTLPDALARLEQAEMAEEVLLGMSYRAIGLDHFALPEDPLAQAAAARRLRRNFQGYTTDDAPVLLGLGSSSIGSLPGGYAQNAVDEKLYAEAVAAGQLPVVRGVAVTEEDRLRARLIERVMCDFALDLSATEPASQRILRQALDRMAPLKEAGLVRQDAGRLYATPAGQRFVRQVAACFDAFQVSAANRHSTTV